MITLYRAEKDQEADKIEEKLESLVVSFQSEIVTDNDKADSVLPYIVEGNKRISGDSKLDKYITELERELHIQRSVTGDACYIDPDTGEIC